MPNIAASLTRSDVLECGRALLDLIYDEAAQRLYPDRLFGFRKPFHYATLGLKQRVGIFGTCLYDRVVLWHLIPELRNDPDGDGYLTELNLDRRYIRQEACQVGNKVERPLYYSVSLNSVGWQQPPPRLGFLKRLVQLDQVFSFSGDQIADSFLRTYRLPFLGIQMFMGDPVYLHCDRSYCGLEKVFLPQLFQVLRQRVESLDRHLPFSNVLLRQYLLLHSKPGSQRGHQCHDAGDDVASKSDPVGRFYRIPSRNCRRDQHHDCGSQHQRERHQPKRTQSGGNFHLGNLPLYRFFVEAAA